MNTTNKILLGFMILLAGGVSVLYVDSQKSSAAVVNTVTSSASPQAPLISTVTVIPAATTQASAAVATTQNTQTTKTTTVQPTQTTTATPVTQSQSKTVSTTVNFSVPKGHTDSMSVTATVKDGVITNISFDQQSSNHESEEYYQRFESRFSTASVVGKNIGSVSLSRVGGATLTTNAFNRAVSNLASQI
jgi:hypothetical protein